MSPAFQWQNQGLFRVAYTIMDYMGYDAPFTGGFLWDLKNTHSLITMENRTHVDKNVFNHKDFGEHPE